MAKTNRLSGAQLRCLQHLDRAAMTGFGGDIDGFLTSWLRDVSSVTNLNTSIVDQAGQSLWGADFKVENNRAHHAERVISLGLGSLNGLLIAHSHNEIPNDVSNFLDTAATQLGLSLVTFVRRHQSSWLESVSSEFFREDLHPEACFDALARHLAEVFPKSRLLSIRHTDVVQVLVRHAGRGSLTIVATTGDEKGHIVGIQDSVAGMVFDTQNTRGREFVLDDPTSDDLAKVYKSFTPSRILCELVIPLRADEGVIGAINLESADLQAFTVRHLAYLRGLSSQLTDMVDALRRQVVSNEHTQMGVASTQTQYWRSVVEMAAHDTRGRCTAIRDFAVEISDSGRTLIDHKGGEPHLQGATMAAIISHTDRQITLARDIERTLDRAVEQFDGNSAFGPRDVRDLVESAVRIARKRLVTDHDGSDDVGGIKILNPDYSGCSSFEILASDMMKVYLQNVLDNSTYWLQRRKDQNASGEVAIHIRDLPATGPAPSLNRRVEITIRDNGPGTDRGTLKRLNAAKPDTVTCRPGGEGLAMRAFRDYVLQMGGWVKFESEVGRFFETSAVVPVYVESLHNQ